MGYFRGGAARDFSERRSREGNPLTRLDLYLVVLSIFSRLRRQETTARPVIPPETKANLSLSLIWVGRIRGSAVVLWRPSRMKMSKIGSKSSTPGTRIPSASQAK